MTSIAVSAHIINIIHHTNNALWQLYKNTVQLYLKVQHKLAIYTESMLHASRMLSLYTAVLSTTANATIKMAQKEAPITIIIIVNFYASFWLYFVLKLAVMWLTGDTSSCSWGHGCWYRVTFSYLLCTPISPVGISLPYHSEPAQGIIIIII